MDLLYGLTMPLYRCQMSIGADSPFPRDYIVNTVYLADDGLTSDPNNLIEDMVGAFQTWYGSTREIWGKIYNQSAGPSGPPVADHRVNAGVTPNSNMPREVALCLSFYGSQNTARKRGRIYLCLAASSQATFSLRPAEGTRNAALALAQAIAGVGGTDVDWSVYSPTAGADEAVQVAYVDDEWDTIRSRGLRPTARSTAQINE